MWITDYIWWFSEAWMLPSKDISYTQVLLGQSFYMFHQLTWIAVDVHFWRTGGWSGKDTLLQRFRSCRVLGLFNAGTFCLPYLFPKWQLHSEDLKAQSGIYKHLFPVLHYQNFTVEWQYSLVQSNKLHLHMAG